MSWLDENIMNLHKIAMNDILANIELVGTNDYDYLKYDLSKLTTCYEIRKDFVSSYSWSIPCKEAFDLIKKYSNGNTIYDVFCGTGYWCKLLQDEGFNTIASDLFLGEENKYKHTSTFVNVEKKDAIEVIASLNESINILLSWPPYEESLGYDIVKRLPEGSIVFYLGEGYGGCCGDDKMFECFENEYDSIEECCIPKFFGLHDYMHVYMKKSNLKIKTNGNKRKIKLD